MDQTAKNNGFDSEDLIDHDEDIDEIIDWEEDLEHQFGISDDIVSPKNKGMGSGFSKQKQVMEENQYYRGDFKKRINIKDKTKR